MKVVNIDERYEIFPDSVKTYDTLPAKCYVVEFSKMTGFYLAKHEDLQVNEKVYGSHPQKVNKVLKAFSKSSRSLGVIASGAKGIGKSMLFRMLAMKVQKIGIPVIIIDRYYPGISNYIESIDQEVMVLFDEFDKTIAGVKQMDGSADAQTELLGLFDGTSSKKKLFVITCNDIYGISDFLVNRPGRFHYHFRFDAPTVDEIREYMTDKIGSSEWAEEQINEIVKFSRKVPLNYDCLRAISFELEEGVKFRDIINDLNILNNRTIYYEIILRYQDGTEMSLPNAQIDLFHDSKESIWLDDEEGDDVAQVTFNTVDMKYSPAQDSYIVPGDKLHMKYDTDCYAKKAERLKDIPPVGLFIKAAAKKNYFFTV